MTIKSLLRRSLLFPVWIVLASAIGCGYWGFKFEALADAKEVSFNSVEQQLSAIDCKQIDTETLLSIARLSFESPRDEAKILWSFAVFLFGVGVLNLGLVLEHLRPKPMREDSQEP